MSLYNLARMTTSTTGTGTITLGSAISGCLTFDAAGVQNGDTVTYAISDGANSEIGRGVYTASGTTLTRSVLKSTNSDAAISLSGNAQVFITAAAEDFSDRQPLDAGLTDIAALAVTDGNIIVGDGTHWVAESGATARTSLGLGSIATQASNSVSITGGSISGITDLAVADGGTGAGTAADARTNLGLAIGTDVAAATVGQGKQMLAWVPADQMYSSGNPSSGVLNSGGCYVPYLAFDPASDEYAFFNIAMPKKWNEGNISAIVYWCHPATTTNFAVVWMVAAAAFGNDDALENVYSSQNVTDVGGTTSDLYISDEVSGIDAGNAQAENDLLAFVAARVASSPNDTLAVDAYLVGVKIYYTTNAATDD